MFSEVVDAVAKRATRSDKKIDVTSFTNATIRELQLRALFYRDLVEDQITATSSPFTWTYPTNLRQMAAVRYVTTGVWPLFKIPSRHQEDHISTYYAAAGYYAFRGVPENSLIDIAYYTYLPRLQYYEVGARPAVFDEVTQTWTYLQSGSYVSTLGSTALDEAAQALVTNWLLTYWKHVVEEGSLAKLYKVTENRERAVSSFALYKSYQEDLLRGEVSASVEG